jgi:hypothetical protein
MSPTDSIADLGTRQAPEKALRPGVLYADGRRAATVSPHSQAGDEAGGERLTFLEGGRGGTDRQWATSGFIRCLRAARLPLSHPGCCTAWAELDSSAIHEAAGRAVTLWPDESDDTPHDG